MNGHGTRKTLPRMVRTVDGRVEIKAARETLTSAPRSIPGTVPVTGPIAPTSTADAYASHYAFYGKGGMRSIQYLADLTNVPTERREAGMQVYVVETQKVYQLANDLLTWLPGASGPLRLADGGT